MADCHSRADQCVITNSDAKAPVSLADRPELTTPDTDVAPQGWPNKPAGSCPVLFIADPQPRRSTGFQCQTRRRVEQGRHEFRIGSTSLGDHVVGLRRDR